MSLWREIGRELRGMFLADARLSGAVLALVAIVAALRESGLLAPMATGAALLLGALGALILAVSAEARRLRRRGR